MAIFSYNSPAFAKHLEGKLHVVVKPQDTTHAKVYFEERVEGRPAQIVPIPSGYQLVKSDTKELSGKLKGRFFCISYHYSYHLKRYGDSPVLKITNQQIIE